MPAKTQFDGISREAIRALLGAAAYQPMTAPELVQALNLHRHARNKLSLLLGAMVNDGEIVVIRKNRYALGRTADLVTGPISVARQGDGFIDGNDLQPTVRIRQADLDTALPGDTVVARLEPPARVDGSPYRYGKVVRIVQRAKRLIVGTLKSTGTLHCVVPLDASYHRDFYVPDPANARVGDRVVVQFTNWADPHVNPEGTIIEVIGPADNPSLDTVAIIRHYGLPEEFPPAVIREAETVAALLDNPGQREDLRGEFIFTVDPATARDFDDALSLVNDNQGQRVLGVHIADVSHFVRPGSALDDEAAMRGNTVYLPDRVLPMLPEQLSNGVCSLKPDQDRMAFSAFITFNRQGQPVAARFAKSIIRSRLRLTYEQAMEVIRTRPGMRCAVQGVDADTLALIQATNTLAQQLRRNRWSQYALDLDIPECDIIIGTDGMISDIRRTINDMSHQMVEECMVAANEAVDRELMHRAYPSVHRLHEPPAPDKIADLIQELREMGFQPGDLNHRRNLADFLNRIQDAPLAFDAQVAVLRSMKRAVYSATEDGHFGLAKKFYTHFTSPIRRYPDLIVHRILMQALLRKRPPYTVDDLTARCLHCSNTEQTAAKAERDILEIKKYRFLEQQLKQNNRVVYDAVVVKPLNFGMFVEIGQLEIQGLIHISKIADSFVRFDPARKCLRAGNQVYATGSKIKVVVASVDFENRRIDLLIAGDKIQPAPPQVTRPNQRQPKRPTHVRDRRRKKT